MGGKGYIHTHTCNFPQHLYSKTIVAALHQHKVQTVNMSNVPKVANFITHSFPVTSSRQNTVLFCSPARPLHSAAVVTGDILNNPQTRRWVLGAALAVEGQHPGASTSPGGCIGSPGSALLSRGAAHTPNIAFRHLPPRKDVVNKCLEFGGCIVSQGSALSGFRSLHWQSRVVALTVNSRATIPIWVQRVAMTVKGQHPYSQRSALV